MRRLPRCPSEGLLLTYDGCSSVRHVHETADITSFAGGEAQASHPKVETCSSTMLVISGSKSACFERGHRRVDKNTSSDTFKWCSYDAFQLLSALSIETNRSEATSGDR